MSLNPEAPQTYAIFIPGPDRWLSRQTPAIRSGNIPRTRDTGTRIVHLIYKCNIHYVPQSHSNPTIPKPMKPRCNSFVRNSVAIASALAVGSASSAFAASATWNGTTDATWATGTNWSATPVPGTGDTATFNNAGGAVDVINLGAGVTIGNLIFDTSSVAAYTIGSGAVGSQTLTLNNGGAITANSTINANQLFNANLVLGTDATAQSYSITNSDTSNRLTFAGGITGGTSGTAGAKTLNISTATGGITLSGAITNGGATSLPLSKTGAGILTLSGSNSHSGTTTITGGNSASAKLLVSGTGALTGGGALQVGSGALPGRFEYTSSAITTQFSTITLGGGSNGGTGTLVQSNGTITATTLRSAPGRTGGNVGNIDLSGGTLRITGTATIGEQDLNTTPSTVTVSGTGLFQVDNGLRVGIAQSDTRDGNGIITQNGGTVTVAGGLTLAGTANGTSTRTGIYNLNGGTLNVNAITMATTGAGTNTSTFNFAGGTLKPTASSTTFMQGLTTANVRNGGAKIDTDGNDITIAQSLVKFAGSTTDTLTKSGVGTLTLSGTNTYTGGTTVNGGSLVISGNSSSANGAVSVVAGSLYVSGRLGGNVTIANGATIGSGIDVGVGAGVIGGTLTLNGTSTLDLTNLNGTADLSALSISFASAGFGVDNLTLGGAAINWDAVGNGTYTLLAGTLNPANLDNFGFTNRVSVGSLGREAYFQNGSLQLVVIPEPSAALLGGLGLLVLMRRRRA
jgi:autotransporter-associated beta strand protein